MNKFIITGLVCLFTLLVLKSGDCKIKNLSEIYSVPTIPPFDRTTKRVLKCVCDDDDQPVCASNGVSYPSTCRFQCAKQKVPRLRVVKSGSCGGATKQQFWNSAKKDSRF